MFVLGKIFQLSVMLVSKTGAYLSEAPFRFSALGSAPGLAHKHFTVLERLAGYKHCSLLLLELSKNINEFN